MPEKEFPEGFRIYPPREAAPDYVLGDVVIDVQKFTQYMRAKHADGEVRLTLKRSRSGNVYAELNTWRPNQQTYQPQQALPPPPPLPRQHPDRYQYDHYKPGDIGINLTKPENDYIPGLHGDEPIADVPFNSGV